MQKTPAERLKQARINAGYKSAAAFANEHGFTESTYRSYENTNRELTIEAARQIAEALGVPWKWLLFGDGDAGVSVASEPPAPKPRAESDIYRLQELDVRAAAGEGALIDSPVHQTVAEWTMPRALLRGHTTASAGGLKIITVYGDSMSPEFQPGDRVMVDTGDRVPSPPGVFVIWDGFGLVVKRVEMIPYSDPPMMRLLSRNDQYETRELPAREVVINGRVVGKWQWT